MRSFGRNFVNQEFTLPWFVPPSDAPCCEKNLTEGRNWTHNWMSRQGPFCLILARPATRTLRTPCTFRPSSSGSVKTLKNPEEFFPSSKDICPVKSPRKYPKIRKSNGSIMAGG